MMTSESHRTAANLERLGVTPGKFFRSSRPVGEAGDLCNDCGACCMTQTSPPGYTGQEYIFFATPEDERQFYSAPQEAQDLVYEWQDRVDGVPDGAPLPADEPCCWFDARSRRCRYYEWRPSVCREFEVGGEACLLWRAALAANICPECQRVDEEDA